MRSGIYRRALPYLYEYGRALKRQLFFLPEILGFGIAILLVEHCG